MIQLTVAFDCDGTLIKADPDGKGIIANERIRSILVGLAHSKNVRIIVWSESGEIWARQVGAAIGIDKYVWKYASKNLTGKTANGNPMFDPELTPDIAIDDIQDCTLGVFNIIVREK